MTDIAIAAQGIWRRYQDFTALADVSIDVAKGEFVSLVGPSGSGKTTLLRILGGFDQPDAGRVFLDGADVTELPPEKRRSNMVFQRGALFPHMTVAENIAYPLRQMRMPRADIDRRVSELLDVVRLSAFGGRKPSELSGGQAQRIALARALAPKPPVLLLDEPFSALDLALRKELQLELRRIHRELDCAFVFVTHDQEEALVLSDRIAIMDRGVIVQLGAPADIYLRPSTVFTSRFIGEMNVLDARLATIAGRSVEIDVGRHRMQLDTSVNCAVGAPALLLVRPENITLHEQRSGDDLAGVIEEATYLGSRWRVRVRCEALDTTLWAEISIHDAPAQIGPGVPVFVALRPDYCRLMNPQSA